MHCQLTQQRWKNSPEIRTRAGWAWNVNTPTVPCRPPFSSYFDSLLERRDVLDASCRRLDVNLPLAVDAVLHRLVAGAGAELVAPEPALNRGVDRERVLEADSP